MVKTNLVRRVVTGSVMMVTHEPRFSTEMPPRPALWRTFSG